MSAPVHGPIAGLQVTVSREQSVQPSQRETLLLGDVGHLIVFHCAIEHAHTG
jgi:hypothetical protein